MDAIFIVDYYSMSDKLPNFDNLSDDDHEDCDEPLNEEIDEDSEEKLWVKLIIYQKKL